MISPLPRTNILSHLIQQDMSLELSGKSKEHISNALFTHGYECINQDRKDNKQWKPQYFRMLDLYNAEVQKVKRLEAQLKELETWQGSSQEKPLLTVLSSIQ